MMVALQYALPCCIYVYGTNNLHHRSSYGIEKYAVVSEEHPAADLQLYRALICGCAQPQTPSANHAV